jgi:hypothetical protein
MWGPWNHSSSSEVILFPPDFNLVVQSEDTTVRFRQILERQDLGWGGDPIWVCTVIAWVRQQWYPSFLITSHIIINVIVIAFLPEGVNSSRDKKLR